MEFWFVTGASGQLGGHVLRALENDNARKRVVALVRDGGLAASRAAIAPGDLLNPSGLRSAVLAAEPTHVLHVGAMTAVGDCFARPDDARTANTEATRTIAAAAAECGARLVYCSTDMVFAGDHAPYCESDQTRPLSHYGRTKADGERAALECDGAVAARLPLLFGFPCTPRRTTFCAQVDALRAGQPLRLFTDEYRTPLWLEDAARALIALARSTDTGVVHVAGPQRLSRYEMIVETARALGVNAPNLTPISRLDIEAPEPRPADLSLDGSAFLKRHPGFSPRSIADALSAK
ncbi:MAG: SDR family oxidoreductase [Planctomycetes bacterium]|nr:SDR family oxidoreductase [Planctomycetota bacterium]